MEGGHGDRPTEVCDGLDNDGDGEVDEGLRNECGACSNACFALGTVCTDGSGFALDASVAAGVTDSEQGELMLERGRTVGEYRHVFVKCGSETRWDHAYWEADVPAGASVTVFARTAATSETLETRPWQPIEIAEGVNGSNGREDLSGGGQPNLGGVLAGALELRFELHAAPDGDGPLVSVLSIECACGDGL